MNKEETMSTRITEEDFPINFDPGVIVRGADWPGFAFQLVEDDNVTPLDTTGYTVSMPVSASENGEVYTTLSIGSGITMTAASGLFAVNLTDTAVDAFNFRTAIYKLIVTDAGGIKTCYFMGKLLVKG